MPVRPLPGGHAAAARRFGPVLGTERAEQVRTAAETMAVGALFLAFSLPLVTAGAAWCAAAEVVAGWHEEREAPLLRTFASVVRRDLRAGLALQAAVLGVLAATWLEVHAVLDSRIPGRPAEAAALVLLGAAAVALALLAAACRASDRTSWAGALRTAVRLAGAAPGTLPLVVTALACVAALVATIPAFAGFMAGPLAYAVSVAAVRAARREQAAR
ncbi:hypothetical protein [Streptomyces sp. NPDC020983]|uniref:hypothetical protein n=1 Tax=Streptomyces sp. NPDC020983 TaxID=3365106 RepID=UPI0037A5A429